MADTGRNTPKPSGEMQGERSIGSPAQWEHVFRHAGWGIAIAGGDSRTLDIINPAFAKMHGYTVQELTGAPVVSVFASSFRDQVPAIISLAHEAGHHSCEVDHVRKDGSVFPVQLDVTAVKDDSGRVLYPVVYVHDISERKRVQQALRDSESLAKKRLAELEHVYATAPIGLCLLDRELRFLRINERLAEIHGVPVADHITRTLREAVPGIADLGEAMCFQVLESGEPILNRELQGVMPAHPSMVALGSLYPLKSNDGTVEAVSVVIQDITERKLAEQALRESEERIARILESAMDAIVTIDEDRQIRLFNAAAEDVFRCQGDHAIGTSLDRFCSPGLRDLVSQSVCAFRRRGVGRRYMWAPDGLSALRADGEAFPIEATISQSEAAGERLYTMILRDVNDRRQAEEELRRLQIENLYLREESRAELEFGEIVGDSRAIRSVLESIRQVAGTDSTVLITGETGTGKELVARAIHELSHRSDNLLVKVNCAALPTGLIESELFGHEKGAFTGALTKKVGRFEMADGSTVLLDEIGDLPIELQAKLLRVLQEGEYERVGGTETLTADVRVIAATNKDLETEVRAKEFRSDLFYRLNVFPIRVPPLRERREDIAPLARHFTMKFTAKLGKRIDSIPKTVMQALAGYAWPGNIRELQNVVERAVILTKGSSLELHAWPPPRAAEPADSQPMALEDVERRHILTILEGCGWRVSGSSGAAALLGLKPTTLHARMKKLGIERPS